MVKVFVARETRSGETRVAATPETTKQLHKAGLEIAVETGAGAAASFPDAEYREAGAEIVASPAQAWSTADVVLAIHPPSAERAKKLKPGAALVCSMQPLLALPVVRALAEARVTAFAMDLMPRITRAQKMDVLSSQATVAGYQAVLVAAVALPKMFPLLMMAAGTLTPARVVVLGAGVAGLQAIATARRLGALVEANDIRPAVREQVESLGASFIDTGTPPQAETTGGYAKETSAEYARKQREILTKHLAAADVAITTALIPGKKAPILIDQAMMAAMRPGSVIVDLAVEMGGNVEGAVSGETVEVNGVKIIGEPNLPAQCAEHASRMFGRNVAAFLELVVRDGKLDPDWEDECVKGTAVTHGGDIRHEAAAEALSAKGAP
jgi:NAD(P) transhydrogenase subunit alpha